jgi:8-oxo-dGTP pyrophosphatase MutT (NUDIX family)
MTIGRFYAGVSAVLWNPSTRKYLLLRRSTDKDFGSGAWECVTGRVDQGEGFADAARREVHEELGIEAKVDFVLGVMHFYRGEDNPENELLGVYFACSVQDPGEIQLSWEHSEARWLTAEEVYELLPPTHWLVEAVYRAETMRSLLPPALLDHLRTWF